MEAASKRLEAVETDDNQDDKGKEPREPEATEPEPEQVVEAARGEVIESGKTVEWEGLTFSIPQEIPAVFVMDQVAMESSNDFTGMVRLLHTLLGADQFTQARNQVVDISDRNSMEDQVTHIVDLINTVLNSYGTEEGESGASGG
jgi:hypothetical protein